MNCKHFKIRTKKGQKYYYCSLLKKEVTFSCYRECDNKEYKCTKSLNNCTKKSTLNKKSPVISGHKHKLTKATEIPMKVKKVVWERDNHKCIYCEWKGIDNYVPVSCANSHYIKRSQLGLGIEQNIVTACPNCHYMYDFGTNVEDMVNYTRRYLMSKYDDWDEKKLVYIKNQ